MPGGLGIWLVAGFGFCFALLTLGLSFVPPEQLGSIHPAIFDGILVTVLLGAAVSGLVVARR